MPTHLPQYALARIAGRIREMPVLVLMPHSRCNCRCVMCDIWKANQRKQEISAAELRRHLTAFRRLGVRSVVLSGGEPLMHSNLWSLCSLLKDDGVGITLLSTGLLLERHAESIRTYCDEVIVSLDGSRDVHNRIRNVPGAFEALAAGVQELKQSGSLRVTARSVIQHGNYHDILNIVRVARALRLDRISFLAADVSSPAFNRPETWSRSRIDEVALDRSEITEFRALIERLIVTHSGDIASGFIAESAGKLRRLPEYFAAVRGLADYPRQRCNAPWVSAVIEADGEVRPCFFHPAFGNIHDAPFDEILNSGTARQFRNTLDVQQDPTCRRCVCTLQLDPGVA